MKQKNVYNLSSCKCEAATIKHCPCCKGDGRTFNFVSKEYITCLYCKGRGKAWVSSGSWAVPLWGNLGKLY